MKLPRPAQDIRTINALLTGAEREAQATGDDLPGPEHLLLAAAMLPDGSAVRALESVGVDADQLRAAVQRAHTDALQAIGVTGDIVPSRGSLPDIAPGAPPGPLRISTAGQQVFHDAVALSKRDRAGLLRSAHVALAVAGLEHGTVVRALASLGVDPVALEAAARIALLDPTP